MSDNQLRDLMYDFIFRTNAKKMTDVLYNECAYNEDGKTYFTANGFWTFLVKSKSWTFTKAKTLKMLGDIFKAVEQPRYIDKKSTRVFIMETPDYSRPEPTKDEIKDPSFKV